MTKWRGLATLGVFSLLASGCAITSSSERGPNGRAVHFIDGMSASVAFQKASEFCPYGYDILGEPRQISVIDYTMTVECREQKTENWHSEEKSKPKALAPSASSVSWSGHDQQKKFSYVVMHFAKEQGCSSSEPALFTGLGPGYENYSVTCANGESLPIQCEVGGCRVLK